jgi:probable F420-dependent oxidoreductase
MRDEYEQAGIAYTSAATRLDRLAESVGILKGLWRDEPFSFEGEHYRISNLDGQPKPVQRPHPPIMMGGGGKRMLTLAAQEANTVNLALRSTAEGKVDNASVTLEAVRQQIGWVHEAATGRAEPPELGIYVWYVEVTDNPRAVAEEQAGGAFPTPDSLLATPHALIGSVDGIVETLQQRRDEFGLSYIAVQAVAMDKLAPVVQRLAGT